MKIKEEKTYKTDVIVSELCDRCGNQILVPEDYIFYNTIKILYKYSAWGDSWTEWGFEVEDICENCAKELRQILIDNGFTVKDKELTDD